MREVEKVPSVVIWFGKEVDVQEVKSAVCKLKRYGYSVVAPFYIGYKISSELVEDYLKSNIRRSDYLYVIGQEGSIMKDVIEYANSLGKPIIRNINVSVVNGCC